MSPRYIGWRLAQVVPSVAGIVLVGWLLIHLAPGDPLVALAGQSGDEAYYAFMREKFGLDRPLHEQLVTYASNVLRGDLGVSYTRGRPATEVVLERVPATLLLTATALVLSSVAGVALGVIAASRPRGWRDLLVNGAALGLYAAPVFWVAQLAVLTLALRLRFFPVQGMSGVATTTGLASVLDLARHLVLPAVVLATQETAVVARFTRAGLLEELARDYVRTARAKGLSQSRALLRHALRRALLPVATVVGARVGHLVSGAIVVEIVFGWPGLGRLLLSATQTRDAPVLLAIFFLVAFSVILANLATDIVYALLDPRIRYR
ncbi:MAG TPA: ABC transporter permease [Egibacteraceae bacterium]|nr:ABC transporter permease [Egibacteraceae bacterium]